MFSPIYISEGLRMFRRKLRVQGRGFKQYPGDAADICRQIIEDCWNGRYFQTSTGHFCEFWVRDFSWCCRPLLRLGYKEEVRKTLEYALGIYSRCGRVTTTISPRGGPFDFPNFSPDSLASLILCLNQAKAKSLIFGYKDFLNKKISEYEEKVLDRETGLVRQGIPFSSIKDHARRSSSCYNNVMLAMLAREIKKTSLDNPFRGFNFKKRVKEEFWNGDYFYDDMEKLPVVTGDSNVFPFWTGIFTEKEMMRRAFRAIEEVGLDKPFPLRYTCKRYKRQRMLIYEILARNYERTTIWNHIGLMYVSLLKQVDRKRHRKSIEDYKDVIGKHKTFLEVYNPAGKPYKSLVYTCDEGILWSSMLLEMLR